MWKPSILNDGEKMPRPRPTWRFLLHLHVRDVCVRADAANERDFYGERVRRTIAETVESTGAAIAKTRAAWASRTAGHPGGPCARRRATSRGLLRGHRPAGRATGYGMHADRGGSRGDVGSEAPSAVRRIDGDRADESARAACAKRGPIVDLVGRSEAASRPPAIDAFDAELTRAEDLLGQVDGHGVCHGRWGNGEDGFGHRRRRTGREVVAPAIGRSEGMRADGQRGAERRNPGGVERGCAEHGQAVLKCDGSVRHSGGWWHRPHGRRQGHIRDEPGGPGWIRAGGEGGGGCRWNEDPAGDRPLVGRSEVAIDVGDRTDTRAGDTEDSAGRPSGDHVRGGRVADEPDRSVGDRIPRQEWTDVGVSKDRSEVTGRGE